MMRFFVALLLMVVVGSVPRKAPPRRVHQQTKPVVREKKTCQRAASPEPANEPRRPDAPSSSEKDLQSVFDEAWSNHSIVGRNDVKVVTSRSGAWNESVKFWIFVGGQYRTFDSTAKGFARAGAKTTKDWAVVAVMDEMIDQSDAVKHKWAKPMWHSVAKKRDAVPELMRSKEKIFGDRFAYAVLRRKGPIVDYPACLMLWWHGCWAVARWASALNGVPLREDAIILRTRPDVALVDWFVGIDLLASFLTTSNRAPNVVMGQESKGQGDILLISSFATYERSIARPALAPGPTKLARDLWDRANANGWGWGRSILNGAWPFNNSCMDRCLCLDGGTSCPFPVCYVDVVVGAFSTMSILRQKKSLVFSSTKKPIDLASGVYALCPYCTSRLPSSFELRAELPWMKDNRFYFGKSGVRLNTTKEIWPSGCGTSDYGKVVAFEKCTVTYNFFSTHLTEVRRRHVSIDKPLSETIRNNPGFRSGTSLGAVNPNYIWRDNMS